MKPRLLLSGRAVTPGRDIESASLLVEDGRIAWLRDGTRRAPGAELLTEAGDVIVPGFVDLQVNGFGGYDAASGPEAIGAISEQLPASGVTAFLPTIISRPLEESAAFARTVHRAPAPGARVLGAHVEGPFLNPRFRGAHDARWLVPPTPDRVGCLLEQRPAMVTLAPELPGGLEAVHRLHRAGVLVSMGHTGASYAEAALAISAGARFATHLFNRMPPMHHREPGAAAALLLDRRVVVGLVGDGVHVDDPLLDLVVRARAATGIALTTDQVAAAGMPPGRYWLGGAEVISDGLEARRPDGELAGSVATMDAMVRRLAGLAGLRRAVAMATATPARALGSLLAGKIAEGLPADLVVLDHDLQVRATLVDGCVRYRR